MQQQLEPTQQPQLYMPSITRPVNNCTFNKLPLVLHLRSDYESVPDHQAGHDMLVQDAGIRRRRVRNWREFTEALKEEQPALITVHHSELTAEHCQNPEKFVNFVQGLVDYVGACHPNMEYNIAIPIAIGIGYNQPCSQTFVSRLKRTSGVSGIFLAVNGRDPADNHLRTQAHVELIAGRKYWCQQVIDQLPGANELPVSVYFRADHGTYITPAMTEQLKKNAQFQLQYCTDWDELGSALKNRPHQLVFYVGMLTRLDLTISEIVESLKIKMKLFEIDIPIAVGIDADTTITVIKELKRSGIFGLVPSAGQWGAEATVAALNALVNREPYWPRHILDQLPGNKPVVEKNSTTAIQLTARQQEVMDLICRRGLSNKQIAKSLNLSESTVKIHVSAVMKVHGVRNRTQLALSAGTGLTA